jgi:predicted  nucleic acid-binding Zn-ribbon protein
MKKRGWRADMGKKKEDKKGLNQLKKKAAKAEDKAEKLEQEIARLKKKLIEKDVRISDLQRYPQSKG